MKKSQAWSMDIMIALVVFIGTIFVFYSVINAKGSSKENELQEEALIVLKNINITENITKLNELLAEDYPELKRKLRVKNEFCIFLEDEEGNVIYLNPGDPTQTGIGSGDISVSDEPCK